MLQATSPNLSYNEFRPITKPNIIKSILPNQTYKDQDYG